MSPALPPWAAIATWKDQNLDNCTSGVMDKLLLAQTQTQTTGMVKSAPPNPPQAPSIAVFGARRREAMDALVAHEGLLGDRERLIATMGPEGYAQAVAAAAEKAEQATAAYRAVWGALSV